VTTPATVTASVAGNVFFAGADEIAVITAIFTVNGVPTSPTPSPPTLTVTDPNGNVTTPSVTTVSAGKFTASIPSSTEGIWAYTWDGAGTASGIYSGTWTVGTTALNTFYTSLEEMKTRLGITKTTDDLQLTGAVQAASRSVDEITGRFFWQTASTEVRTYIPESIYEQSIDDLVSLTSLKADRDGDGTYEETWVQNTDFQLYVASGMYNRNRFGELWPWTGFNIVGPKFIPIVWPWSHLDRLQVTGVHGWPAVPDAVKESTRIAAANLFRRKDAPFGVAGFGEFALRLTQQDPTVMGLLHRYIRGDRVGV